MPQQLPTTWLCKAKILILALHNVGSWKGATGYCVKRHGLEKDRVLCWVLRARVEQLLALERRGGRA